ncbi:hypothetical protein, partial [Staphylococcus aureus]
SGAFKKKIQRSCSTIRTDETYYLLKNCFIVPYSLKKIRKNSSLQHEQLQVAKLTREINTKRIFNTPLPHDKKLISLVFTIQGQPASNCDQTHLPPKQIASRETGSFTS